jgi:4-amino-4-deoxy-L-arabinose transferase-like glycosyltransferase
MQSNEQQWIISLKKDERRNVDAQKKIIDAEKCTNENQYKRKGKHHTQNIENGIAIERIPNVSQSRQWRRWTLSVRDLASRIHRQLVFLFSYFPVRLCCWSCVCVCVQWHRFSLNWQQVKHSSCFILFCCCWLGFLFLFFGDYYLPFLNSFTFFLTSRSLGWPFDIIPPP